MITFFIGLATGVMTGILVAAAVSVNGGSDDDRK